MRAAPICGVLMLMVAVAGAQSNPAAKGTAAPRPQKPYKDGCPAAVPPSTSDSAAGAADWVELQRTACATGCPAYTVRVYGDGKVNWHGDSGVATKGAATTEIDGTAAKALIQEIAQRGFWGLCQSYDLPGIQKDLASINTTLSVAGHVKRVSDYGDTAPSWLRELDLKIDATANTHPWRQGGPDSETFGDDRLAVDAVMPKVGVTQLMKAAALPDTDELVKTLQLLGPVNESDSTGWTALMYAAQAGPVEAMRLLLQAGADPNLRTKEGETALFAAVTAPSQADARFRLLQAAGVDLNAQDNRGVTPLMVACRYFYRPKLVASLLTLGADPSKHDAAGKTAMDYLDDAKAVSGQDGYFAQVRDLLMKK
jgi:hypothetical protein